MNSCCIINCQSINAVYKPMITHDASVQACLFHTSSKKISEVSKTQNQGKGWDFLKPVK
jgi:hypothetical protein